MNNCYNFNMIKIDCLGDMCPIPVLKIGEFIDQINNGEEVLLVSDHSCTKNSIQDFARKNHFTCKTIEAINGVWEITLTKD